MEHLGHRMHFVLTPRSLHNIESISCLDVVVVEIRLMVKVKQRSGHFRHQLPRPSEHHAQDIEPSFLASETNLGSRT